MYLQDLATKSAHEEKIANFFGQDKVVFEGQEPIFDRPLVILGFTNRSGSNLFADYLRQTGKVSGVGEGLNHPLLIKVSQREGLRTMPDYIAFLVEKHCKKSEAFGIKASAAQLLMLMRWDILSMFPKVYLIHIRRQDLVAQAVSFWIASQSNRWTSLLKGNGETPRLDLGKIDNIISDQEKSNDLLEIISLVNDLPRHQVLYEELDATPEVVVSRTLEFIDAEGDWSIREPKIQKQADETNETFIQAYHEVAKASIAMAHNGYKPDGLIRRLARKISLKQSDS